VHKFIDQNGALGFGLAGVALLIVASLSGGWSLFCESASYKAAFLTGLSFPGLLFGASMGFGDLGSSKSAAADSRAQHAHVEFERIFFASIGPPDSKVAREAFNLVFNPVGVLVADKQRQIDEANRALKEKEAEFSRVKQTLEKKDGEIMEVRGQIAEKEERIGEVSKQLNEKRQELLQVSEKLRTNEREIQTTSQRVQERTAELERVNRVLDEKEREVIEAKRKLTDAQKELERANEELAQASAAAGVAIGIIEKQAGLADPGSRSNLTARVISTVGDVEVRLGEGGLWQKAQVGQILKPGSEVRTKENGGGVLSIRGESVTISSNTQLRILLDERKAGFNTIDLKSGKIYGNVRKDGGKNRFEVRTPLGVAGIRG
jgi:hypothetical protein